MSLPSLTVLVPLAGAVLLAAASASGRTARAVTVATGAATAAAVVAVVAEVVVGPTTVQEELGGWRAPVGIALVVDPLSAVMLALTAAVGLVVTAFAVLERRDGAFWPLWLSAWGALNALYVSGDAFNLYVGLEVLGLAAVGLVALAGGKALRAALRYLFVAVLGSLAYLLAVALLYADRGTLELAGLASTPGAPLVSAVVLALVTVGMVLKTALLPLHGWLPPAHGGAPVPVSPLLSALVVKGSFYVLLRMWFGVLPEAATPTAATVLGILGGVAGVWGAWMALRQERLKLVVAYSTVAQVGYLFLVFPLVTGGVVDGAPGPGVLAGWAGVLTLVLAHGVAKAGMFLAAGSLAAGHGSDRLADLRGAGARQPLSVIAFGLAGISLAGLPPSLGFSGKLLVLQSAVATGQWWWAVPLVVGGLLATAYVARVLRVALTGAGSDDTDERRTDRGRTALGGVDVSRRLELPGLVLAVAAVVLGLVGAGVVELLQDSLLVTAGVGS